MVYLIDKQNGNIIASRWNIQPTVVWTFFAIVCLQIRVIDSYFKSIKMQMSDDITRINKLGYTAELIQPMRNEGQNTVLKVSAIFRRHEISKSASELIRHAEGDGSNVLTTSPANDAVI